MKESFRSFLLSFFCLASYVLCLKSPARAGPGDTLLVQTFTFGSPQQGWFVMPSDTVSFSKIYMLYTLKCNPNNNPYPCGEWDYLTYTYNLRPTIKDEVAFTGYNYAVNATHPDSFSYLTTPAFQLQPHWYYQQVNTDTLSISTDTVGTPDGGSMVYPFHGYNPVTRSQFLWKASDLLAAGISAGNISALQMNVLGPQNELFNFVIRIKTSSLDSLSREAYENDGFTEVYSVSTQALSVGWNEFSFYTPFNWDGVSNLVIEMNLSGDDFGISSSVDPNSSNYHSLLVSTGYDATVHFDDGEYVSIPPEAFASVDSQITIAFWFKGDNFLQDRTTFEALDQYNNRVLNVHLPWSDGNIYWDAGTAFGGGFDRIYKHADTSDYKNNWHYWTFSKNCATGSMKIYRDGHLWHSGTGATQLMKGISTFRIGTALWSGDVSANGSVDEFSVWNKELDSTTIQQYFHRDLDINHPYHENLLVNYQFNDFYDAFTVSDQSENSFNGSLLAPAPALLQPQELFRNFEQLDLLPVIQFQQGVFQSYLDSTLLFDTVWLDPVSLILFNDTLQPNMATDTQLVWLPYYQYVYDANGMLVDSVFITADTTIHLQTIPYTLDNVPVIDRYEIARYITPYGIQLSLGDGWTWTYDVSDYATLLHDSVFLTAGNWQELLDLKFMFIEGTPPRNVLGIQNLWNGGFGWGPNTENDLAAKEVLIPADAINSRVNLRITGHGADNNNCAEFCTNTAYLKVNGQQKYQRSIWRTNCPVNPLYPQGGTWVYPRANWCPGAEVETFNWELTPFVTPGDSSLLDIDLNPYSGSGGANYVTESQLILYGAPNFSLDAEVYDILSPILDSVKRRHNPICNNPLIAIRNDGSDTLTSLTITYGAEGGTPSVYQWSGNLSMMDTAQVRLGAFFSPQNGNSKKFVVAVSNPNGQADENPQNDVASSVYKFPLQYPSHLFVELKTNNYPWENSYTLSDDAGNVILSKGDLDPNIIYKDTIELANGCYTFQLTDEGEDGLNWWANPSQGSGYCRIRDASNGAVKKNFGVDFGGELYQQFTVGYYLSTDELPQVQHIEVTTYPNPTDGEVWTDIFLPQRGDADVYVTDLTGKVIYHELLQNILSYGLTIDLKDKPAGMYLLQVRVKDDVVMKKILVAR